MIAPREMDADFNSARNSRLQALRDKSVTEKVIEYVEVNYSSQISLRHVAQALGYSPCHLTHTFSESTGTPVTAWIIERRIIAAQELLAESNATVAAVAEAVGFNDLCYFTRQFVRHVGVTPGRFRSATNANRAKIKLIAECAPPISKGLAVKRS